EPLEGQLALFNCPSFAEMFRFHQFLPVFHTVYEKHNHGETEDERPIQDALQPKILNPAKYGQEDVEGGHLGFALHKQRTNEIVDDSARHGRPDSQENGRFDLAQQDEIKRNRDPYEISTYKRDEGGKRSQGSPEKTRETQDRVSHSRRQSLAYRSKKCTQKHGFGDNPDAVDNPVFLLSPERYVIPDVVHHFPAIPHKVEGNENHNEKMRNQARHVAQNGGDFPEQKLPYGPAKIEYI